ncbi:hypothetical protein [Halobacillus salinus]|nr:hypothetical protein [Halobacillus salinus]
MSEEKKKHLLCRIGLHKFKQIGWEDQSPAAIFKCDRCGKERRAIKAM